MRNVVHSNENIKGSTFTCYFKRIQETSRFGAAYMCVFVISFAFRCALCMQHVTFWLVFAVKKWIMAQSFLNMRILFRLFFYFKLLFSMAYSLLNSGAHQIDCSSYFMPEYMNTREWESKKEGKNCDSKSICQYDCRGNFDLD